MGALAAFVGEHSNQFDRASYMRDLLAPVAPRRGTEIQSEFLQNASLAILRGRETSIWQNGELVVAFHGALDNQAEIVDRVARGTAVASPAQAVGLALRRLGYDMTADLLRGAFTVLASNGREIRIIRDHVGLRPAYLYSNSSGWYVATEAKQLVQTILPSVEPDLDYLREIIFGSSSSDSTVAFKGLDRAPRASITTLRPGQRIEHSRFWHPETLVETNRLTDLDEAAGEFRSLLTQAVHRTITGSDAIALSGGMDSTTVAALGAEHHRQLGDQPLLAVSAVYPDIPSVDESELISVVAEAADLKLQTFRPTARPLDDLSGWVDLLDGPGSTLSMPEIHEMYDLARSKGAEQILTGELGEYVYSIQYQTLGHLVWNLRWKGIGAHLAYDRAADRSWTSIGRELLRSLAPRMALHLWSRRKARSALPPWVGPNTISSLNDPKRVPPVRSRWPYIQLQSATGDYALTFDDVDVAASVSGISVRYPLIDRDLWEFLLSLRAEVKYPTPQGKALLRRAMNGVLPDEIVNRTTRTYFTDSGLRNASFTDMLKWIGSTSHRFSGIDYEILLDRLGSGSMSIDEIDWAQNLARCHAFLSRWE